MTLLLIVLALLVNAFTAWPARFRNFSWFERYTDWLSTRLEGAGEVVVFALVAALPVAGTLFLQAILGLGVTNIIGLLFAAVVLLYCLGPLELSALVDDYVHALEGGDAEQAGRLAATLGADSGDPGTVVDAIIYRAYTAFFAVVFWFSVLGPVGAVLYRVAEQVADRDANPEEIRDMARRLQGILGWIPARLAALAFALMGNFDKATFKLLNGSGVRGDLEIRNRDLLARVGRDAIDFDSVRDEAVDMVVRTRDLLLRSLVVWLAVLALLTLGGWFR